MDAVRTLFDAVRHGVLDLVRGFSGAFPAVGVEEASAERVVQEVDRVVEQVLDVELVRR